MPLPFRIFNFPIFGWLGPQRRDASQCQISSRLVNTLWRYSDVSIFQNGCHSHLGFLKFTTVIGVWDPESRVALVCQISSKLAREFLIYNDFLIIQDGDHRHFGFQKFSNFISWWGLECPDASPCQIFSKSVKRLWSCCKFSIFQDGYRPPSRICLGDFGPPTKVTSCYLVVFITVQNLVVIDAVVSKI